MAEGMAARFIELPRVDIRGKLSRLLARHLRTKTLVMQNRTPLVSFTFDDVAASACTTGASLLGRYDVRGTFYISGGICGALSPAGRLATIEELKFLQRIGHEIACHTYSHAAVPLISYEELGKELELNRQFLDSLVGDDINRNFAYPYGYLSFGTKTYLTQRFSSCRSLTRGINSGVVDLGALKSYSLEGPLPSRDAIRTIITEAVRLNGWVLFCSHDVKDAPSRYGVTPENLAFTIENALSAGCRIVTVSKALQIIRGDDQTPDAAGADHAARKTGET